MELGPIAGTFLVLFALFGFGCANVLSFNFVMEVGDWKISRFIERQDNLFLFVLGWFALPFWGVKYFNYQRAVQREEERERQRQAERRMEYEQRMRDRGFTQLEYTWSATMPTVSTDSLLSPVSLRAAYNRLYDSPNIVRVTDESDPGQVNYTKFGDWFKAHCINEGGNSD